MLDLVVVAVTYRSAALVPAWAESVAAAATACGTWRAVVADNASPDDTVDQLRRLPAPAFTVVQTGRNGGYSAGLNAALAAAPPARHVLVMNPDVRLDPDCLVRLRAALERTGAGVAAPRLRDEHGRLQLSLHRRPTLLRAWAGALLGQRRAGLAAATGEVLARPSDYTAPRTVDWASGAALLLTAACRAGTGPWDESFFLYSEETEWLLRAARAGHATVYAPSAGAVHVGGESQVSPALRALLTVNRVRLYARLHPRSPAVALFWLGLVVGEGLRAVAGSRVSRRCLGALLTLVVRPHRQGAAWTS